MLPSFSFQRRVRCHRRQMLQSLMGGFGCAMLGVAGHADEWPSRWQLGAIRFHADFPLNSDARYVREMLDLHRSLPQILSLEPSDDVIYAFLFSNRRTYQNYLRQYFPGVPYRRAMFIKQQDIGMVFAYDSDELVVDLRHESTHAVLHTLLPMVPLWLDEGLAEYFELANEDRFLGNPYLKQIQRNVRWHRPASLIKLESTETLEQMTRDAYRDAWSWVHFLLHGPAPIRREFLDYLADINRHAPPGQLSRRLQRDVPDLSRSYAQHFLQLL